MAAYVIDINSTDDLDRVIKKCNTNFRALASQKQQQDIVNMRELEDAVIELDMEIQNVDSKFVDYTKTSDLAAVALSNDYGDLSCKPTITEPVYLADPPETNTVTIQGDNSFDDLGMKHLSNTELQDIINLVESTM